MKRRRRKAIAIAAILIAIAIVVVLVAKTGTTVKDRDCTAALFFIIAAFAVVFYDPEDDSEAYVVYDKDGNRRLLSKRQYERLKKQGRIKNR